MTVPPEGSCAPTRSAALRPRFETADVDIDDAGLFSVVELAGRFFPMVREPSPGRDGPRTQWVATLGELRI